MDAETLGQTFEAELASFGRYDKKSKRDDAGFLRFAWTAALFQQNDREAALDFNRDFPPLFTPSRLSGIENALIELDKQINAAQSARRGSWEPSGASVPRELTSLAPRLQRALAWCRKRRRLGVGNVAHSRATETARRMYFVCALMPYLEHYGIRPRAVDSEGTEYSEKGCWSWFDMLETTFGSIRVKNNLWLETIMCRGGLRGTDWLRTDCYTQTDGASRDIGAWFRKAAKDRSRWIDMCRGAQSFIEWRRDARRAVGKEEARRLARPLDAEERKFVGSAVGFLGRYGVRPDFIRGQTWSFLSRARRS